MFFMKNPTIMFRNYETFGYITDNRNFAYINIDNSKSVMGDKILSESGAVFFSVLSDTPQNVDDLIKQISEIYSNVDVDTIENDVKDFYGMLLSDGFVVFGETVEECEKNNVKFTYENMVSQIGHEDNTSSNLFVDKSTQKYFEEYHQGKPRLMDLHIEITSKCNERCLHCYIPHENKICDIESDMFNDILDQCNKMRLLHVTISGGEPMLHNNFIDFLQKIREYQFSVNVLSNLTLLDDEIIKEMKKNPLLGVQVSLYSMNHLIHDEITQMKGSFDKTKHAILKIVDNNIPLQISCPIMKQNKNDYREVKKWAEEYKISVSDDYVIIARYNHTTQNLKCRLSLVEIEGLINEFAETDASYLDKMKKDAETKNNISHDDFICSVCQSSICIAENGNVYPCAGWQDYIVGNIKDASLEDIWENSEKVKHLRSLKVKDFPKCIQCLNKEYCTMCMVRNANEDPLGDPLSVNEFFCNVADLNRTMLLARENIH